MEDLLEASVYLELEQGKTADYWRDIINVTNDELSKLGKLDKSQIGNNHIPLNISHLIKLNLCIFSACFVYQQ